jgi:hypothetical protein
MKTVIVVPWHNPDQLQRFVNAWKISDSDPVLFQQDERKSGCALTKNRGILRAKESGYDTAIVLDDDCFPHNEQTLGEFIAEHERCLLPQKVVMFDEVTNPPSRGTPYFERTIEMPVAASMGFWTHIGDYDAPGQLVHGATKPMSFDRSTRFGRYFPLCGMNIAFRLEEWPWCQFINVPRFDDIWQGFIWQKKAYARGQCFNLSGPLVRHSRQSNVWANLRDEAVNLERNEYIWKEIHGFEDESHASMLHRLKLSVNC